MTFLNGKLCITISKNGTRSLRVASEAVGATELLDGDWQRIHEQLRQCVKAIEDRHPSPSAAILNS